MMTGAFAGRNVGERFPIVSGAVKLIDETGKAYAAIAHEALYDDNCAQVESLLSIHQSLANPKNGIDDRARCERDIDGRPGRQKARFGNMEVSFLFDGSKCFFELRPISEEELRTLPTLYLTSEGDSPYKPTLRTHSCRHTDVKSRPLLPPWKHRLGFAPDHVIQKTLEATTQMVPTVEAETREVMRDHLMSRLPELKLRRVNDTCYVDTFFSRPLNQFADLLVGHNTPSRSPGMMRPI
jgi:hypothetical protein